MLLISLVDIEVSVFQKSDRNHKVSFFPSSPLFRQLKREGFRSFFFKKKILWISYQSAENCSVVLEMAVVKIFAANLVGSLPILVRVFIGLPSFIRIRSSMEDSTATTIEFLRARLLAERSVSRTARQRADELAERVCFEFIFPFSF